jgi:hypothetical protein
MSSRLATELYEAQTKVTKDLLARITKQLVAHASEEKLDPRNYGNSGDLMRVNVELMQVLAMLGDRTAVDLAGIDY